MIFRHLRKLSGLRMKRILLYDIMTERYEITTILQKLLSQKEEVFGKLLQGSKEDPAVTKISVHHFSKIVSGSRFRDLPGSSMLNSREKA